MIDLDLPFVYSNPVGLCLPPHDYNFVVWLYDGDRVAGCRVRQVGGLFIEVHNMLLNLRVVVTDASFPVGDDAFMPLGYAWCYPKELGYPVVADYVWGWQFDGRDPARIDPPGPWIKAVHSGVYRVPDKYNRQEQPRAIWCPQCGRRSPNPNDIAQRYCGNCHQFHEFMGRVDVDE